MRTAPLTVGVVVLAAVLACDPTSTADVSPEKLAMERACALDVSGTSAIAFIGGGPAAGTITLERTGTDNTRFTVTVARTQASEAEAPFLDRIEGGATTAPLVFADATNRFIGGGNTGNEHSEVTATLSTPARPGPAGTNASIDHALRLVFQESLDEVDGGLTLTFRERRQNVVLEGETEHTEQRSFALRATRADPLVSPRTPECEQATDAFQRSQAL